MATPNRNNPGYGVGQALPLTGGSAPPSPATADELTAWMRQQPWYTAAVQAWGLDPNTPTLTPDQQAQLADVATRAGAPPGLQVTTDGRASQGSTVSPTTTDNTGNRYAAAVTSPVKKAGDIGGGSGGGGINIGIPGTGGGTTITEPTSPIPPINTPGPTAPLPGTGNTGGGNTGGGPTNTSNPPNTGTSGGSWYTSPTVVNGVLGLIGNIWASTNLANANAATLAQQQKQYDEALAYAKEAQTYGRNQYSDYLGRLGPWQTSGTDAAKRISQFMGQPNASAGTTVPASAIASPGSPSIPAGLPGGPPYTGPPMIATGNGAAPKGTVLPLPGQPFVPANQLTTTGNYGGTPSTTGPASGPAPYVVPTQGGAHGPATTVQMRAPDGKLWPVPISQVAQYQLQGYVTTPYVGLT